MNVDIHSAARALVQKLDRRLQTPPSQPKTRLAAQKDGAVISNAHRILNFQGPGVTVSNDPASRRTNIFIPGSITLTSSVAVNSAAGQERVLGLGVGGTPPTNWDQTSFSDAAWAVSVAETGTTVGSPFATTQWICETDGNLVANNYEWLARRTFTLPAGSITSASILIWADNLLIRVAINGTFVLSNLTGWGGTGGLTPPGPIAIPTGLLVANASNLLAVHVKNTTSVPPNPSALDYQVNVNVGQAAAALPYVNVQDQRTASTQGGTFTSGSFQTRTLNTLVNDTGSIASLSANRVTLPAGTYRCRAVASVNACNYHQSRLQNITDATTALLGTSMFTNTGGASEIDGRFTITGSKAFELQHRCSATRATDGLGTGGGFGTEVYAILEFWKEV